MRVKAGDIVLVDESLEQDYGTRKYKAIVLWDFPFQQQPLLTDVNEWRPHWGCYRHIAKIIGHIDLQQAILKEQETVVRCKDCKWYQEGIDIDGKPFTRCNGNVRTYGHTKSNWFCADGKRR